MDEQERLIREMSDKAFASHTITERMRHGAFRSWRCQQPGSWCYGFDVTTTPGSLIMTGDLQSIVLCREYDMVAWARKAVDDIDYFSGKITAGPKKREFSEEKLKKWLKEQSRNKSLSDDRRWACREMLADTGGRDPGWFMTETYGIWQDEAPDWTEWNPQLLWQRDAIRWFVNHVNEPELVAG